MIHWVGPYLSRLCCWVYLLEDGEREKVRQERRETYGPEWFRLEEYEKGFGFAVEIFYVGKILPA